MAATSATGVTRCRRANSVTRSITGCRRAPFWRESRWRTERDHGVAGSQNPAALVDRKHDAKLRSARARVDQLEPAAMQLCDVSRDRETEAGATRGAGLGA